MNNNKKKKPDSADQNWPLFTKHRSRQMTVYDNLPPPIYGGDPVLPVKIENIIGHQNPTPIQQRIEQWVTNGLGYEPRMAGSEDSPDRVYKCGLLRHLLELDLISGNKMGDPTVEDYKRLYGSLPLITNEKNLDTFARGCVELVKQANSLMRK